MQITIGFKSSTNAGPPMATAKFFLSLDVPADRKEAENMTPRNAHAVLFAIARKRLSKVYPRGDVYPLAFSISQAEYEYLEYAQHLKKR